MRPFDVDRPVRFRAPARYHSRVRPMALALGSSLALASAAAFAGWWTVVRMPGRSVRGPLAPLSDDERAIRAGLEADVEALAGGIGERHVFQPEALARAADHVETTLRAAGLDVRREAFVAAGETCANLVAEIRGTARPDEIVVVGAHYDTVRGSPGADDNASGVAALLALARRLAGRPAARTVRLVAFANEENPFHGTDEMGALVHARAARARGDRITAMLALETLGYFDARPGSQGYPFPFSVFYPDTADFTAFVSRTEDRALVRRCVAAFRGAVEFPCEGAAPPAAIRGVSWSDHAAFWEAGYPAAMATNTAFFRNERYHRPDDLPESLDLDRLARVVVGLEAVVADLARAE